MNKLYFFIAAMLLVSCNNPNKISITKVEGSPEYSNSVLKMNEPIILDEGYKFSFDVNQYELGIQTLKEFDYQLANSAKGQHIHFIVNNGPYSAHYEDNFTKNLEKENNVILAFLSRSYHESVKNLNAYVLTQTGNEQIDLDDKFLFYSRPKGTYKGIETEKLLLDFYLVNTKLSSNGNKVRATIQETEFIIEEWAPYYIEGLPKGEIKIKLELIDASGNLIDSPFNPSNRTVILE
ncbi:MAG: phosphopeptide-binding protein [Flavobacteriaceae bacterium]|nr:phosphopeptide-binding protein [Flavobacteriaceae bacterium]|tara:strand:+ start:569 stop:1276 length:708 start_codon:yes stop_codon:yes gene_type:complete